MPRAPYMNFPFPFYKAPYGKPQNFQDFQKSNMNNSAHCQNTSCQNTSYQNASRPNNSRQNSNVSGANHHEESNKNCGQKNKSNKYTDDYLFDLFGLKIFSDDVLLVSLLYFLYSEGVKDDGLFIVLILLLLS